MTRIETERLLLDPYVPEHLEAAVTLYGDPEVTRHTKLGCLDRVQAKEVFAGHLANWAREGRGLYALSLKSTGDFVGECGFFSMSERPEPFLRYALLRRYWGRGLAREAIAAVLDQGFDRFALGAVMSVVEERNAASHRIMRALGFRLDHDRVAAKGRIFVYALAAGDWAAGRAERNE
ncbi:MAG: GNAT family N-acetyltransferase [Kiloniellales bacterium]|nr:GNAT family N-acetyltransferase [Kiloniellales bacterium]